MRDTTRMDDAELDRIIDAMAPILGLAIEEAWRPAIRTHLRISLGHAENIAGFPLTDELDPAPVFSL
jgi:hypothetical protein